MTPQYFWIMHVLHLRRILGQIGPDPLDFDQMFKTSVTFFCLYFAHFSVILNHACTSLYIKCWFKVDFSQMFIQKFYAHEWNHRKSPDCIQINQQQKISKLTNNCLQKMFSFIVIRIVFSQASSCPQPWFFCDSNVHANLRHFSHDGPLPASNPHNSDQL